MRRKKVSFLKYVLLHHLQNSTSVFHKTDVCGHHLHQTVFGSTIVACRDGIYFSSVFDILMSGIFLTSQRNDAYVEGSEFTEVKTLSSFYHLIFPRRVHL